MRLKSVGVTGLFGVFNHEIPLSSVDRVTIIHGPNGFGKTVMLGMIAGVIRGDTSIFMHTPFSEFFLKLEDGSVATVRRVVTKEAQGDTPRVSLEFLFTDANGSTSSVTPLKVHAEIPPSVLRMVDTRVPGPFRVSGSGWIDDTGRRYSVSEILERFPNAALVLPPEYRTSTVFERLSDFKVFFVETNRLGGESAPRRIATPERYWVNDEPVEPVPPRVKQYSDDIVKRIQSVLADYAKHSQESDRTFPERLVRFARNRQAVSRNAKYLVKCPN